MKKIKEVGDDFKRPDVVFTSSTYDFLWPNKLNDKFREIREEMGLSDDYTIQSIRHTHATWLLRQGHPPTAVARRLGHSDTDTIFRHYRKYVREEDQSLVNDLEENFYSNKFVNVTGSMILIFVAKFFLRCLRVSNRLIS